MGKKSDAGPPLSHLDDEGHARMVDVGEKPLTARRAVARATVSMSEDTFLRLSRMDAATQKKGDVLAAARIAGILGAKKTSELIPLCHMVPLTQVEIEIRLDGGVAIVEAVAEACDRTGVEMEALVAASTAALTLYDMLKSIDRAMSFDVRLLSKSGGQTGTWTRSVP